MKIKKNKETQKKRTKWVAVKGGANKPATTKALADTAILSISFQVLH